MLIEEAAAPAVLQPMHVTARLHGIQHACFTSRSYFCLNKLVWCAAMPRVLHYGLRWDIPGSSWEFDKHWYQDFDVLQCAPWNENAAQDRPKQGLFHHPPHPDTLTSHVSFAGLFFRLMVTALSGGISCAAACKTQSGSGVLMECSRRRLLAARLRKLCVLPDTAHASCKVFLMLRHALCRTMTRP